MAYGNCTLFFSESNGKYPLQTQGDLPHQTVYQRELQVVSKRLADSIRTTVSLRMTEGAKTSHYCPYILVPGRYVLAKMVYYPWNQRGSEYVGTAIIMGTNCRIKASHPRGLEGKEWHVYWLAKHSTHPTICWSPPLRGGAESPRAGATLGRRRCSSLTF